jgi:hypothetical protein
MQMRGAALPSGRDGVGGARALSRGCMGVGWSTVGWADGGSSGEFELS